jgi:hypothetical protein
MSWNALIVLGCLVGGYVVVSMLMNIKPDDLRPPPERDDPPPPVPSTPSAATNAARLPPPPRHGDWTLLLDVPRSASARDIEAAFRRQQARAAAAGDQLQLENLRRARDTALAEKKQR